MKQEQIYLAYSVISSMRAYSHTPEVSFKLFKLNRQLKPIFDFQKDQRTELLKKYSPKKIEGNNIEFNTPEDCENFKKDRDALSNLDAELDNFKPVRICLNQLSPELKLYPDDFEVLDGIIDFYEEEPKKEPEISIDDIKLEPVTEETED